MDIPATLCVRVGTSSCLCCMLLMTALSSSHCLPVNVVDCVCLWAFNGLPTVSVHFSPLCVYHRKTGVLRLQLAMLSAHEDPVTQALV